jgi:hypothetical protein
VIPYQKANYSDESTYQQCVKIEGIPVRQRVFIQYSKVRLKPWDRDVFDLALNLWDLHYLREIVEADISTGCTG